MTYRKLELDGTRYEYVVGRTHVKVKGVGVWPKAELETEETRSEICHCGCGETLTALYGNNYTRVVRMVKPNAIANKIRETVQQVKR